MAEFKHTDMNEQKPYESDIDYLKRITVVANARLRALEKLATQKHYHNITGYSYRNALYDIEDIRGKGKTRFSAAIPKEKSGAVNERDLHKRINAVKRFLDMPTSTKTGITNIYKQRAQTTNERYGTNFTWEDLANYYESDIADVNDALYGSSTIVRALGSIRRVKDDVEAIQKAKEGNLKLSNDDIVNRTAIEMLNNGLDPDEIFK